MVSASSCRRITCHPRRLPTASILAQYLISQHHSEPVYLFSLVILLLFYVIRVHTSTACLPVPLVQSHSTSLPHVAEGLHPVPVPVPVPARLPTIFPPILLRPPHTPQLLPQAPHRLLSHAKPPRHVRERRAHP
ncbi:hypothetical protein LshimejAT787_1901500 [Lyophyllum shimeji]|uniref:Uncharacterized protein n=1 Tax=Lyophyllum shimeji TaxID=47721 RepID=A0A9P3UUE6_LYOSH|nr:hypothetical protein LshimejAT787_1901500 [Lyophyllum shimeji]